MQRASLLFWVAGTNPGYERRVKQIWHDTRAPKDDFLQVVLGLYYRASW
jgi:hypothetical protein